MASNFSHEQIKNAFVDGCRRRWANVRPEGVMVLEKSGNQTFAVRLDANRKPLSSPINMITGIDQGTIQPNCVPGAKYLLIGMVQSHGAVSRITARIVEVETAVVQRTARTDVGSDVSELAKAFSTVVRQLL